jgi:hypothetical protein
MLIKSTVFPFEKNNAFYMWSHWKEIGADALDWLKGGCLSLLLCGITKVLHISDLGLGVARDIDQAV